MYDRELLLERLSSVLTALERIPRRFAPVEKPEQFFCDEDGEDRMDSICMTLIAVGEEIKKLDRLTEGKLFQLYPQVAWKGVMGLRDVLAHTYFDVDAEQLFSVCKERIPVLIEQIRKIISDLENLRI